MIKVIYISIFIFFALFALFSPKTSLAGENIFGNSFDLVKQSAQDIQEKIEDFFSGFKQEKQDQITQEIQNKLEQAEQSVISHLKIALWQGIKDFWRGSIKTGIAIARYFINFIQNFLGKIFKDII